MCVHSLTLIVNFIVVTSLPLVSAHSRWSCPEPRSPYADITRGPCGEDTDNFDNSFVATADNGSIIEISPGPLRVTFEEALSHTGAPFRISLSGDGTDENACVLLDHIPHNDCCEPDLNDPTTYTPYTITIMIPNIICERCSLHLSNPATDRLGDDGSPLGIGCEDPGECYSVYRSCTKAFRIIGDASKGAIKRSNYECPSLNNAETGWPSVWTGDDGEDVDASIPGLYRRESSIWSEEDSTLITAPGRFREDAGGLCGAQSHVALRDYVRSSSTSTPKIPSSTITPQLQTSPPPSLLPTAPKNENETNPSTPASPAAQLGLRYSASLGFCMICIFVKIVL